METEVKGGIVVYLGHATDNIESAIQHERDNRLNKLGDLLLELQKKSKRTRY